MVLILRDSKYSEDKTPKWAYWKQFKFISFEDAIYLSLDINPHMMPWMMQEATDFYCDEISERTEVAYNWAETLDWYIGDIDEVSSKDRVELIGFASWVCNQMKWKVPAEFMEIAGQEQDANSKTEDSEKPLSLKELNNLLKLIGALHQTIMDKGIYRSDDELKTYLEAEYQSLGGFSKRNLDSRLSSARKALNESS
jgi:hypothetical protein